MQELVRGQNYLLPVKCAKCGIIFDLEYEIFIDEPLKEDFIRAMKIRGLQFGLLCRDCR